jgi:trans-aconitate methyltransferase
VEEKDMSTSSWKKVWDARKLTAHGSVQEKLIRANGFDSGAGEVDVSQYTHFVKYFSELINLKPDESLFEVGCGSGAFLYPLRQNKIGGLDYSKPLIDIASEFIHTGSFTCNSATNLDTEEQYDHVFSHSVFQYLSLDQAQIVLSKMIQKSRKTVSILDIPNIEKREEQENERKKQLGEDDYNRKYQNLFHTYYSVDFFKNFPRLLGKNSRKVDTTVMNYSDQDFRFGIVFYL